MDSRELLNKGKELLLSGQLEESEQLLCDVFKHWTSDDAVDLAEVQYWRARCLFLQHRFEEAEVDIPKFLSPASSDYLLVDIHWLHADIKFALKKLDDSENLYWAAVCLAVQLDPDYFVEFDEIEVFAQMLTCFYLTDNHEKAVQTLQYLYIDDVDKARILSVIGYWHTRDYGAHGRNGEMSAVSCTRCLEQSIRFDPLAETFENLGRHLWLGGEMAEAVVVYRHMESLHPDEFNEDSARSFGLALEALGSVQEAEHWLRKSALEYCPDDFFEVEPLITFYGQYQRWIEARDVCEQYISAQIFDSHLKHFELSWAWSIHARCCELLGDSDRAANSHLQENIHREQLLRDRISKGEYWAQSHFELGICLKSQERTTEAEIFLSVAQQMFVDATQKELDQNSWWGNHWLGVLYEERGDFEKAEACFREAMRVNLNSFSADDLDIGRVLFKRGFKYSAEQLLLDAHNRKLYGIEEKYWLGKCLLSQGRSAEAEKLLAEVARDEPFDSEYARTLEECRLASELEPLAVIGTDFSTFVDAGRFWLESAHWDTSQAGLLSGLYTDGKKWANEKHVLFSDFHVSEDDLDDALARAVAVSRQIHLAPEVPVELQTERLEVSLDLEGQLLRAWVGRTRVGVAVTINIETWELYYAAGDRDAMFAAGVAINWFLDCSIALTRHPKFIHLENSVHSDSPATNATGNIWMTQPSFDSDVKQILAGRLPAPPKAHRVRGHIRRLGDGLPSDNARDNAPPYIRRHMSPDQTWVRGHSRGGDSTGAHLLTHLQSFSSLADFLATARRA